MPLSEAQSQTLQFGVEQLLQLFKSEPSADPSQAMTAQASLKKAVSPTFEVVFAGAFSAGKSMLINALLGREICFRSGWIQS